LLSFAVPVALLMLQTDAKAGTWPESDGHALMIYSVSWFQSRSGYGPTGQVSRYGANGLFNQILVTPYIDLGITRRTSVSFNPALSHLVSKDAFNSQSGGGFGDVELSVRHQFATLESGWLLSGQGTWMFPAYSLARNPAPGNHEQDFEGRLLAGRGGAVWGKPAFVDLQAGYRYRSGAPADQVRADGTVGFTVIPKLTVMGQFFGIKGMRNGSPVRPNSNPNAQSDFDLYKGQGSVLIRATSLTTVQLGWGNTIAGRNTGKGSTIVLALWRSF
jgi:hypothetical protein